MNPTNVLHLATQGTENHSASFPPRMPEFFIKLFTRETDTVLDCFMGAGTSVIKAKQLNRNAIGIDIKEEYIAQVKRTLNQEGELPEKSFNELQADFRKYEPIRQKKCGLKNNVLN